MPEKDFERQVQEKMDGLKLRPSEPVWYKIEKAIGKKKTKRRILFIIPLFAGLILLGYYGYRYYNHRKAPIESQVTKGLQPGGQDDKNEKMKKETEELTKNRQENPTPKKELIAVMPVHEESNGKAALEQNEAGRKKIGLIQTRIAANPTLQENKDANKDINDKKEDHSTQPRREDIDPTNEAMHVEQKLVVNDKQEMPQIKQEGLTEVLKKQIPDTLKDLPSAIGNKHEPTPSLQNAKSEKVKPSRIGMRLSVGVSDIRKKLFSFSRAAFNTSDTGGPLTGSPQPGSILAPSETFAGPSYRVGLTWEKEISIRSRFSTGLNYAYYSNHINVGGKTNALLELSYAALSNQSVIGYYTGTQYKRYINRYHFIELPVGYQLQLNRNKRISLIWDISFSAGRLLSSNELMYDTARGGIYFHSDKLFNKTHFSLLNGLSLRFKTSNGMEWTIGPQFAIDLSRMSRDGFDKDRYIFSGWMETHVSLPRKTKR